MVGASSLPRLALGSAAIGSGGARFAASPPSRPSAMLMPFSSAAAFGQSPQLSAQPADDAGIPANTVRHLASNLSLSDTVCLLFSSSKSDFIRNIVFDNTLFFLNADEPQQHSRPIREVILIPSINYGFESFV
jgi:hypothetical protein